MWEFIFNLFVIIFIKGDYATGLVGVSGNIFYFDLIGVFLRIMLLTQLFELRYFTEKKYFELYVLGTSSLFIVIKSIFFSYPIIDLS